MTDKACHLHKLRDCKRCPERPANNSLTGSAVYSQDQAEPAAYWQLMSDEIWAGTGTNIKPCEPIPCGDSSASMSDSGTSSSCE